MYQVGRSRLVSILVIGVVLLNMIARTSFAQTSSSSQKSKDTTVRSGDASSVKPRQESEIKITVPGAPLAKQKASNSDTPNPQKPLLRKAGDDLKPSTGQTILPPTPSSGHKNGDDLDPTTGIVESLEKYVIGGSYIASAAVSNYFDRFSLDKDDLAAVGVSTGLLGIIQQRLPQVSDYGNFSYADVNSFGTAFSRSSVISLHNALPLILLNGHRLAISPAAAIGGAYTVDVDSLPIEAIDHIEIIPDQAVGLFGTDAANGVVNIRLKGASNGNEIGGSYAQTSNKGSYIERSAYCVVGGKIADINTHISASFTWRKVDPIFDDQRPFVSAIKGTMGSAGMIQTGSFIGGNFVGNENGYFYLNPSLEKPSTGENLAARGYTVGPVSLNEIQTLRNQARQATIFNEKEHKIGTFEFDRAITDSTTLFGDFLFSQTTAFSQLPSQPVVIKMHAADPGNVIGINVGVSNLFVDNSRTFTAKTDTLRGVTGLRGEIGGRWTWETMIDYSRAVEHFEYGGLISSSGFASAVRSGSIAMFSRLQRTGAVNEVEFTAKGKYTSDLSSIDFRISGMDLFELPGGGLGVLFGAEGRNEALTARLNPETQDTMLGNTNDTWMGPFDHRQVLAAGFTRIDLPLVGSRNRIPGIFDASLKVNARGENVCDFKSPTALSAELKYFPIDDRFGLQVSLSNSSQIASLYQRNAILGSGLTNTLSEFGNGQANERRTAGLSLKLEHSRNLDVGLLWVPEMPREFVFKFNYFDVRKTGIVCQPGASGTIDAIFHDVELKGSQSNYANWIHVGDFSGPTISAPGQISRERLANLFYVAPSSKNLGTLQRSGFDVRISYSNRSLLYLIGCTWSIESNSTYYRRYDIQPIPESIDLPVAGHISQFLGAIPRWSTNTLVSTHWREIDFTLAHTYYPSIVDATGTLSSATQERRIPDYSTFDTSISYHPKDSTGWLRGIRLTLGINNIGNRIQLLSDPIVTFTNTESGEFSQIGRLFYLKGSFRF